MIPKNTNIAFKVESENEFNIFLNFVYLNKQLFNIENFDLNNYKYKFFNSKYLYYDNYSNNKNIKKYDFWETKIEKQYLILNCKDVINMFRKQKLIKILKNENFK